MRNANILADARQLSSGTISHLIGDKRYVAIDAAQAAFVAFVAAADESFETWHDAWAAFRAADQGALELGATPPATPATDTRPRDLFGQPFDPPVEAAPRYRPRAPAQQSLNLDPGTYRLGE